MCNLEESSALESLSLLRKSKLDVLLETDSIFWRQRPPCTWCLVWLLLHNGFSGTVLCYWDILPPVARLGSIHAAMHFSGSSYALILTRHPPPETIVPVADVCCQLHFLPKNPAWKLCDIFEQCTLGSPNNFRVGDFLEGNLWKKFCVIVSLSLTKLLEPVVTKEQFILAFMRKMGKNNAHTMQGIFTSIHS